eukprot:278150_1
MFQISWVIFPPSLETIMNQDIDYHLLSNSLSKSTDNGYKIENPNSSNLSTPSPPPTKNKYGLSDPPLPITSSDSESIENKKHNNNNNTPPPDEILSNTIISNNNIGIHSISYSITTHTISINNKYESLSEKKLNEIEEKTERSISSYSSSNSLSNNSSITLST